jgi:hypothetical protein
MKDHSFGRKRDTKMSKKDLGIGIAADSMGIKRLEGSYSKGGKTMYAKSLGFAIVMIISLLSSSSYGQTAPRSFEDINPAAVANGTIVIISEEKTDVPGYVHTKYAFVDQLCGAQLVDHYGPPIDPNDKQLKQVEKRGCMEIAMDTRDGD